MHVVVVLDVVNGASSEYIKEEGVIGYPQTTLQTQHVQLREETDQRGREGVDGSGQQTHVLRHCLKHPTTTAANITTKTCKFEFFAYSMHRRAFDWHIEPL